MGKFGIVKPLPMRGADFTKSGAGGARKTGTFVE